MTAIGSILALILLFVWSIPGTIALRWVLLVVATAMLIRQVRNIDWDDDRRSFAPSLSFVVALTAWLLIQAIYVSSETGWALGELRGQWLPALMALLLGSLLSLASRTGGTLSPTRIASGIGLVFAGLALIAVLQSGLHWLRHGELLRHSVPLTGGKLELSFVLNLLFAIVTVDLFCRICHRPKILNLPIAAVIAMGLIAMTASYIAASRNGIFGFLFLSVSAISLFFFDQRKRLGTVRTTVAATAIAALLASFATANVQSDPRWQKFTETAALAWNIDPETGWEQIEAQWPILKDGSPADHSAFIRIAFWRTGLRLIADLPLGYGYGRDAFGHALRTQGHPVRGHAHSGWLDIGVGGGIPGLALWAGFLGVLIYRGWHSFFTHNNSFGLLLFFFATGYTGRMFLDSVNKDHMLQVFLFLVGILLVLTSSRLQGSHE